METAKLNREEKKKLTRSAIIGAAMELFNEQGYESTTVEQITKRAGVAKGTFFNYFENKEDVLCDMQTMLALEQIGSLRNGDGPLRPSIQKLIREMTSKIFTTRPIGLSVFQSMLSSQKSLRNQCGLVDDLTGAIIPLVEGAQRRGELTRRLSPAEIGDLAVQTYFGAMLHWAMGFGDEQVADQMERTFDMFFRGMAPEEGE